MHPLVLVTRHPSRTYPPLSKDAVLRIKHSIRFAHARWRNQGADHRVANLIHCLGAGQAFKCTPVFGEIVADCIAGDGEYHRDIEEFSIAQFDADYTQNFWQKGSGKEHALEAEAASL